MTFQKKAQEHLLQNLGKDYQILGTVGRGRYKYIEFRNLSEEAIKNPRITMFDYPGMLYDKVKDEFTFLSSKAIFSYKVLPSYISQTELDEYFFLTEERVKHLINFYQYLPIKALNYFTVGLSVESQGTDLDTNYVFVGSYSDLLRLKERLSKFGFKSKMNDDHMIVIRMR